MFKKDSILNLNRMKWCFKSLQEAFGVEVSERYRLVIKLIRKAAVMETKYELR